MESKKRKPLADITNTYNLIPTSTLRELVAASSNPNLRSKPPISILKSVSSSTNQNPCSQSSNRSDASIGSSDVHSARNSRTVQFRTPTGPISSTTKPGGSRNLTYNQRQTAEEHKKEGESRVLIVSPTPVEKRKDKGKVIALPFSSSVPENEADVMIFGTTPLEKRKGKGKAIAKSLSLSVTEGEADALIFGPSHLEKGKDKGKAINVQFGSSPTESEVDVQTSCPTPVGKKKDKGNASVVPPSSLAPESKDVLIFCPTPVVKRKDKGKAIDLPVSPSPYESEANVQTSSSTPVEKRKDKGKAIAIPFSSSTHESEANVLVSSPSPLEKWKENGGYVEILEDSGKKIHNTYSRSYKKAEKGKVVVNSSISSMGAQEVVEKGTSNHPGNSNEGRNHENDGTAGPSVSSITKRKEREKEFVSPAIEKAKENGKHLHLFSSLLKKTRNKGKAILQPSNIVEIAKRKESSGSLTIGLQPTRRKNEKGKIDAGASSCPPMRRNKNLRNALDEVGDVKSSNSWTDPRPKSRKRRCSRIEPTSDLPQDFIEQQKAYFKEVDEFELLEEEVSQDELD